MINRLISFTVLLSLSAMSMAVEKTGYEASLLFDLECVSDYVTGESPDPMCDDMPLSGKPDYIASGSSLDAVAGLYTSAEQVTASVNFPDGTVAYNKDTCNARTSANNIDIKSANKWSVNCGEVPVWGGENISSYSASGRTGKLDLIWAKNSSTMSRVGFNIYSDYGFTFEYDENVFSDLESHVSAPCLYYENYNELPHDKITEKPTNVYVYKGSTGYRFFCLNTEEVKDIYSETQASEVCSGTLDPQNNQIKYNCDITTRLVAYFGEKILVPIQVGDITTFIPVVDLDDQISTEIVSNMSEVNVEKQAPAPDSALLKITCGNAVLASNIFNVNSTLSQTFDADTDEDASDGSSLSQTCFAENSGVNEGESIQFKGTYVNATGSLLQPESVEWTIDYNEEVSADNEWSNAELYFNSSLIQKMQPIQYLLANLNVSLTNEVTQEQMECELSNALYEAIPLENQYLDEFYVNDDVNIPQACIDSDGSRAVYWMYINDPLTSSIARLDDMPVSSLIDAIDYFSNAPAAYSAYIAMITDDLVAYLEGPVTSFMGLANEYSDTLQLQTCSNLSSALATMVAQITNPEYETSKSRIVINNCQ